MIQITLPVFVAAFGALIVLSFVPFAWGVWSRMFLDEMAAGEPQRRWPEWLIHIPTVYHEFDFSRPYSYVVLPQDTL
jgi:hypothetical protein